jgi:beta-lactamase class A
VITREQQDERTDDNEGYVLIRAVSALLWRTFEPGHLWTPAPGIGASPTEED